MMYQIYGDWMVDARTWYEMTAEELRAARIWGKEQEAKRMVKVLARRDAKRNPKRLKYDWGWSCE